MRTTKAERFECGEGQCSIAWGPIIAAGIGAAGSLIGGKDRGGGGGVQQQEWGRSRPSPPVWGPEQYAHLWGGQAWNPYQTMPHFTPEGLAYGQGLMGGGQMGPMGVDQFVSSVMGGGGDVLGMLGFGAPTAPPLLSNNPLYQGDLPPTRETPPGDGGGPGDESSGRTPFQDYLDYRNLAKRNRWRTGMDAWEQYQALNQMGMAENPLAGFVLRPGGMLGGPVSRPRANERLGTYFSGV